MSKHQQRLHVLQQHLTAQPIPAATSGLESEETAFGFGSKSASVPLNEVYDYIVVGGGSAGAVVAARLSEDPGVSVLLVEAGGEDDTFYINTPGLMPHLWRGSYDWSFETEVQKNQFGRRSFWPRGKVLGGCSSINAMFYVRGNPENYNEWAKNGCSGWSYNEVLPYFKKSENCTADGADPEYHGKGGPLPVSTVNAHEYAHRFVESCVNTGIPPNKDYNALNQEGVGIGQVTIENGIRQNTSRAFLKGIRANRKNLTIATQVYVTKLLFQDTRCTGILFKRGGTTTEELKKKPTQMVQCRKEVILCAGAVNSPWLLLLSGVGPREQLQKFNIPMVADLPVGKNLLDHLMMFHGYSVKNNDSLSARPSLGLLAHLFQYLLFKSGPATSCGLEASAFLRTGLRPDIDYPDLQMHFVSGLPDSQIYGPHLVGEVSKFWKNCDTNLPVYGVSIIPTLLHPKSVGYIELKSADPFVNPVIQPNYFSDPEGYDLQLMVEGIKLSRKIAKTKPFADHIGKEIIDPEIPYPPESEEYMRELARKIALTVYHPVGTCKMGRADDPTTVCTPDLKIKGLQGIRVVDCSIMPTLPSGNTNAPAIMVAEKAADLIKADNQQ